MPDGIKISALPIATGKKLADSVPFSGGDPFDSYRWELGELLNAGRTGLTGGGATNLDGVVTTAQDVTQIWQVGVSSVLYPYQLATGTDAQNSPFIIRPLDFDTGDNPKVFKLLGLAGVSVATNSVTAFTGTDLVLTGGSSGAALTLAHTNKNATLTANLLFPDATYDVGAFGATRPRDLFLSRNATVGGNLTVSGTTGVGTVSPATPFEVAALYVSAATDIGITSRSAVNGGAYSFRARQHRGTVASPSDSNAADFAGILFQSYGAGDFQDMAAIEAMVTTNTPASGDSPASLLFKVTPDGSGTPATALTITQDKSVTFAGTTDASDATGTTGSLGTKGGLSVAKSGRFGTELFCKGTGGDSGAYLTNYYALGGGSYLNNEMVLYSAGGSISLACQGATAPFDIDVIRLSGATGNDTSITAQAGSVTLALVPGSMNYPTAGEARIHINPTGGYGVDENFTDTMSSGVSTKHALLPVYTQTGTAGSIDLGITRTETSLGSGVHKFVSLKVGASEKFYVDNIGSITGASNLTLGAATSTLTLGATNTGSLAVNSDGALTITPKSGQVLTVSGGLTVTSTLTLSGAAANISIGSNYISNGGTDAGISLDSNNNATISGDLTVTGGNVGVGVTATADVGVRIESSLASANGYGLIVSPTHSTALTGIGRGIAAKNNIADSTAATNLYAIDVQVPTIGTGASATTSIGLAVGNQGVTSKTTNAYGVYIAAQSGAATTNVGLYNAGTSQFTEATDSSSSTTGSATFAGGVGIAKKLYVGTDLAAGGNLTVSGTGASTFAGELFTTRTATPMTLMGAASGVPEIGGNYYYSSTTPKRYAAGYASRIKFGDGITMGVAGTASQDSTITYTDAFTISNVGNATLSGNLTVSGTGNQTFGGKFIQAFAGESSQAGLSTGTSSSSFITQKGTNASTTARTWYAGVNPFATDGSYEIKQAGGYGLSIDYSGNIIAPDLYLGTTTSHPSVKSSLAARAPRQGLVFDGTAGATGSLASAIAAGDGSFVVPVAVPASNPGTSAIFSLGTAGVNGNINAYISGADLYIILWPSSGFIYKKLTGFVTTYGGKTVMLSIVRNATTPSLTVYVNGVAATVSEVVNSGATWATSITQTTVYIGKREAAADYYTGYIGPLYVWNRALTAAEVLALAETGSPAATDYNPYTFTNTTFYNYGSAPYTGFSGESATGFTVTGGLGNASSSNITNGVKTGEVYLVTYDLTLNSGTAPSVTIGNIGVSTNANTVAGANGANTATLTITSNAATAQLVFTNAGGAGDFTVANVSIKRRGLLLAPEANAPGNGYVLNSAPGVTNSPIVLPASGVTWALPSSQANRVRCTTAVSGNTGLCTAAGTTLIPANSQIVRVRARAQSGTPTVRLGTASAGEQVVADVALSTTWKVLTIALTDGIVSSASQLWAGSDSADVVEWDIAWEPLNF
jgi:hypothetical protein